MKAIGTGSIGLCVGYYVKQFEIRAQIKRAEEEQWIEQRQTRWSPLLEAAREFQETLVKLKAIYEKRRGASDRNWEDTVLQEWEPGDFSELYVLDRNKIYELNRNLESVDPLPARKDPGAVERTRLRACHQLTLAASAIYKTARYLAAAEHVLRDLQGHGLMLPGPMRAEMVRLIREVESSLHGKREPAGIFFEQQDAIGEIVWGPSDRVISNFEFRAKMFEPGWEQFVGLFRFYVHFQHKLGSEVADTIAALEPLISAVSRICEAERARVGNALGGGHLRMSRWSEAIRLTLGLPTAARGRGTAFGISPP